MIKFKVILISIGHEIKHEEQQMKMVISSKIQILS